ncbi:hypothetical protein pb186bvf_012817 [Paramecium bursaria]
MRRLLYLSPIGLWLYSDYSQGFKNQGSAVAAAGLSFFDYKYYLSQYEYNSDDYHRERAIVNKRVAERILHLSKQNKGVYLKAGQYIGNLERVMPKEFTDTLKVLQDQCPQVPYTEIQQVIQEEFGQDPKQLFSEFDEKAIAAASLAQVHKARLRETGELVAVKVQFPYLEKQYPRDLFVINKIAQFCDFVVKEYNFTNIFQNFQKSLLLELDFKNEEKNGLKTKMLFKNDDRIYVPEYRMSSKRCLIMEFVEGQKINEIGQDKQVAKILIDLFGKMIFQYGHVHCDAHPGNILIRRKPKLQLILLDHGFYTDIPDETLKEFRKLWLAMAELDYVKASKHAVALGVEEQHLDLLPLIFFFRTKNSKKKIGDPFSKEERKYVREKDLINLESISNLMNQLPPELMYIIRAANLVGIHNSILGGTTRDRLMRFTHFALENEHRTWFSILWGRIKMIYRTVFKGL